MLSPDTTDYNLPYSKFRKKAYKIAKMSGFKGGLLIFHPYRFQPKRLEPHFHLLGHGFIKWSLKLCNKTGWVVKNLGYRKTISGTAYYQLSHCGVHEHFHAVTWFGKLSYGKMKIGKMPEPEKPKCPICKRTLVKLIHLGGRPPPKKTGEYCLDPTEWAESFSQGR